MAVRRSLLTYVVLALVVVMGAGVVFASWRLANGLPIIPGQSDAGTDDGTDDGGGGVGKGDGSGACGSACDNNNDCAGPNPICTSSGTCYDAQECGDGGSSGGSGGGSPRSVCDGLDDNSKKGQGASTFEITQGETIDMKLYTEVDNRNGGRPSRFIYAIKEGLGKLKPKGNSQENNTKWTLTAAESAELDPGTYEAVAVSVKDEKGTTGGFGTECVVTLEVAAAASSVVLSETTSQSCNDSETVSTATFTVTMRNVTDEAVTVEEVSVDLDAAIEEDMVSNISDDGAFASGVITWTDIEVAADSADTVTYDVEFEQEQFDNVANTVSATVEGSEQPDDATSSTLISCELPDTAIINEWADKLLFALVLIVAAAILVRFDIFNMVDPNILAEKSRNSRKNEFEKDILED